MLNYKKLTAFRTHYVKNNDSPAPLRAEPNNSSEILQYIPHGIQQGSVLMRREWADGEGKWSYVTPSAEPDGVGGYILTKYLQKGLSSFSTIPKAKITLQDMSPMAKALIPEWYENTTPYYHRENGEWWVTVTLPYTCIEPDSGLESYDNEASEIAIQRMYDYYGVSYEGATLLENSELYAPAVSEFENADLSNVVSDYYLSTRPGAKLKALVIIPAIYLEFVKNYSLEKQKRDSSQAASQLKTDYKFSIPIDSLDELSRKTTNCLKRKYQDYLSSNYRVKNFNFESEIKKIQDCIQKIKFLLIQNDVDIRTENSKNNNRAVPPRIINLYFTENSSFKSISISEGSKETFLIIGFLEVTKSYPFNEPRACSMFLGQNEYCVSNIPLKQFFEEFVSHPEAVVTTLSKKNNASANIKRVGEFGAVGLGISVDAENVLKNIAQSFNGALGLDGNIDYGSFRYSGRDMEFKLQAIEFRDTQVINSGDFLTSASFVSDLKSKLGFGGLDELYDLALSHIDLGKLFSAMGSYYETSPDSGGLDTSDAPDFQLPSFSTRLPSFNLLDTVQKGLIVAFEVALAGIVLGMIIFALESLISILQGKEASHGGQGSNDKTGTSDSLGSYSSSNSFGTDAPQNTSTFNAMNSSPMPLGAAPNPSSAALISKDYGASNINDLMKDSIGIFDDEVYAENLTSIFSNCGISSESIPGSAAADYLNAVSSMIAPIELLNLFEGSATKSLLEDVHEFTTDNYSSVFSHVPVLTTSVISDFFYCLGDNITPRAMDQVENTIANYYTNPVICQDIARELENIMCQKCQNPSVYNSVFQKDISSKVDKYKKILDLLKDSSNSLAPNIFNKPLENPIGATGEGAPGAGSGAGSGATGAGAAGDSTSASSGKQKGILSKNKPKSQNFLLERMAETMTAAPREMSKFEASSYFSGSYASNFHDFVNEILTKPGLIITVKGEKSGKLFYFNSEDPKVKFRLLQSGGQRIEKVKVGGISKISDSNWLSLENIVSEAYPVPSVIENMLNNSADYLPTKDTTKISKAQSVFYELIQNYVKQNSKTQYGGDIGECGANFPIPYLVTKLADSYEQDGDDHGDDLFDLAFTSIAEKIARSVSNSWIGKELEEFEADFASYSEDLNENIASMVDYDKAKEDIAEYYDLGDFEDPNDDSLFGPKEYSILNGLMKVYFTIYVVEFLCRGLPFYRKFELSPLDNPSFYNISKDYIIKMVEADLGSQWEGYNYYFNSTFDFIKMNSDLENNGNQYSGNLRGMQYYIDENFNKAYEMFQSTLLQGADTENLSNFLIYSKTKSLPPHSNSGNRSLTDARQLGGLLPSKVKDVSDKAFSLFGNKYDKFKNGMFFVQKYLVLEDKSEGSQQSEYKGWYKRNRSLTGVISPNMSADDVTDFDDAAKKHNSSYNSLTLDDLFKNVRIGSRLCYGLAVDPSDTSSEFKSREVAAKIFNIYATLDAQHGDPAAIEYDKTASRAASYGKYLICHDGTDCKIGTRFNESVYEKPFEVELNPLADDFDEGEFTAWNALDILGEAPLDEITEDKDFYMGNGTYSVVIPLFNRETDLETAFGVSSLEQITWADFKDTITSDSEFYDTEFKNLRQDIITSEEYKTLANLCFSMENILLFNTLGGIQYYSDKDLFRSFVETKKMLKSNMQVTMNSRKYDYKPGG